jgi:DNA modification methylase/predicted RNA-binding Zn-ribbon protein involved in translation (DUF1610 family)
MDIQKLNFIKNQKETNKPVTCLGKTFSNDEERRKYFTEILREKLPELKNVEGFPIGKDEDILKLSDPPYYTACPNPFINNFLEEWENEKEYKEENYYREPFASDVSEGKNHPIYNAHSFPTKVPHKAIMRYILHYTNPGDIIFDGFCGSGMTGVAARMCGDKDAVSELGYQVNIEGDVFRQVETEEGKKGEKFSKLGERKTILNDLSPAATFISYNYNTPVDVIEFEQEANRILKEVEKECGWMYETQYVENGKTITNISGKPVMGKINYTVWSDVFICPNCGEEIIFWDVAVDKEAGKIKDTFKCQACGIQLKKRNLERAFETFYDSAINKTVRQAKQVPELINYTANIPGKKKRFEKKPDEFDLKLIQKINNTPIPYWVPTDRMPEGYNTAQPKKSHGITHVHHFYTKRNLIINSAICKKIITIKDLNIRNILFFGFNNVQQRHCILNAMRFNVSFPSNITSGTLYIASIQRENNILDQLKNKWFRRIKPLIIKSFSKNYCSNNTSCASQSTSDSNSIDYIFTDPPFGANIMYSELNYLWESWLKVKTNNGTEVIINKVQGKGLLEYQELMTLCFKEYYRVLKPGRWMTVEFSNSKASIWNAIQEAISKSGFVIANVSALDKQQGSFKAVTTTTAVKQDLVISAYKPSDEMINQIKDKAESEESVWVFIKGHLEKLPVFIGKKGAAEFIIERTPRILFDRMVSYYVQNWFDVPISSAEFQMGVAQRFPMRDGMAFLPTQVAEYEKKRIFAKEFIQIQLLVSDESSAIEWLRQRLMVKPQTRQDIHPDYMKEIQHIDKHELLPELDDLLDQNFIKYEGTGPVPSQIHTYLSTNFKDLRELGKEDTKLISKATNRWYVPDPNKQADLEKLRDKMLIREFNTYLDEIRKSKKKLKFVRTEAVRAGFKKCWAEKNYKIIIEIGNKISEKILQEDDKLLMYYDNALIYME